MGFIIDLIKRLFGMGGGASAALQGQQSFVQSVLEMINSPQVGGLDGLSKMFHAKGMGDIVNGWIKTGPNPPVNGQQLQDVLGSSQLQAIAAKLGISPADAASKMAQYLPNVVDQLTPDGTVPKGGFDVNTALGMLKDKLLK